VACANRDDCAECCYNYLSSSWQCQNSVGDCSRGTTAVRCDEPGDCRDGNVCCFRGVIPEAEGVCTAEAGCAELLRDANRPFATPLCRSPKMMADVPCADGVCGDLPVAGWKVCWAEDAQ
jgi:hypothetical protein